MPYSDAKLAQMARRRDEIDEEIKKLKGRKEKLDGAILKELTRRGTKSVDTAGIKITLVRNENVVYDYDGLGRDIPKPMLRRIQKTEVDKSKLAELITSGRIDSALVARHSEVVLSSPYIRTSKGNS